MLTQTMPENLRPYLLEVIFDFRPGEWSPPSPMPTPPSWTELSEDGKQELRRLGELGLREYAENSDLTAAIEATLDLIG